MATNRILGTRLTLQLRRGLVLLSAGVIACTAVIGLRSNAQPAGATAFAKIVSWGDDEYRQVSEMPSGSDFTQVSLGERHSVALRTDGSLVSWGEPSGGIYGQVSDTPSGTDFTQVSAGRFHSVALKSDGSLVSWGMDIYSQVSSTPSGTDFTQVSAGYYSSVALKSDGSLVSWGYDAYGQVASTPSGTDFEQVDAGGYHSVALKSDGSLVSWGWDGYGQVSNTPSGSDFAQVSGGMMHSAAVRADGSIASWGYNGNGEVTYSPGGNDFAQVSAGYYTTVALKTDGSIVSWWYSGYGPVSSKPSGTGFTHVENGYGLTAAALKTVEPAVVVRIGDVSLNEGSGPAGTTASLLYGTDRAVNAALCVWYTTENDGATGADKFTAFDGTQDYLKLGVTKPKFSLLGASKTAGKISMKVNYDAVAESDEVFMVKITKVTAQESGKCVSTSTADPRVNLARANGFVQILDDDTPVPQE
ncbi:Regulator of chromosome condensation (RCC1) repeat [Actinobacteria bacterium IMCC26256]|nr:Regulator of chromosome condensation (RCC1) repeat [Actinobacteria bacterium IMCC26256]